MLTPENADPGDLPRLAQRIQTGERAAEAELVERFRRGLTLALRHRCGDAHLAEDLAHDALLLTLEKIRRGEVREPERLAAFLHGTARNLWLAHRRKESRYVAIETGSEEEPRSAEESFGSREPGQLEEVLREEETRLVRQLLGELTVARDRELLIRFYLSRQEQAAICADLGIAPDHFRRVLYRARERLRELWDRFQERERQKRERQKR